MKTIRLTRIANARKYTIIDKYGNQDGDIPVIRSGISNRRFSDQELRYICTERCEEKTLGCIVNCPTDDLGCISNCLREDTLCIEGNLTNVDPNFHKTTNQGVLDLPLFYF